MSLTDSPHRKDLREAGWHSRGYLPHFDGRAIPQFITLRLFDSVPDAVLRRWRRELDVRNSKKDQIVLQRRIEKYLDQGYGDAFMRIPRVAEAIQQGLRDSDGISSTATMYAPTWSKLLLSQVNTAAGSVARDSKPSRSLPNKN